MCSSDLRGDPALTEIRKLFVKPVVFAGAGISRGDLTLDVRDALARCDLCLYDALMDTAALRFLPAGAEAVPVGKRSGDHSVPQEDINTLILRHARGGRMVVRLRGGDPGVFGRLAEEVDAVENLRLPYRVLPGVSSFQAAAAEWGILLTRRGVSRGFTVVTPRREGGGSADIGRGERAALPVVVYMGTEKTEEICRSLIGEGRAADEPAAALFGIGSPGGFALRSTLAELPAAVRAAREKDGNAAVPPGLLVVGAPAAFWAPSPSPPSHSRTLGIAARRTGTWPPVLTMIVWPPDSATTPARPAASASSPRTASVA